jgi:hypothetical protein
MPKQNRNERNKNGRKPKSTREKAKRVLTN